MLPWFHLALADPADVKRRSALALLWMTLLLGAILLVASAWLLARWRRRVHAGVRARRQQPIADAWAEAGRRAEPITVDLDPPDAPPRSAPRSPPDDPPPAPRSPRASDPAPRSPQRPEQPE